MHKPIHSFYYPLIAYNIKNLEIEVCIPWENYFFQVYISYKMGIWPLTCGGIESGTEEVPQNWKLSWEAPLSLEYLTVLITK